ncbi:GlsB/YeaQ/YmgE family stress response membrane protein [Spongiactinospora gelatinilytica]|uniref:GlsB/YeaQ/YmgE family stress response membrane protein n=1 Tax=Spongiactinospora gelatinilytica TaxID=2666298 RepID=A0A2W2H5K8_9ACTN|nr:GlsB/YeaQ/YmgE family stress response membrane protein [Spongiactinospora gelatinilytica]PZG45320.1 GlsB/YeaQ/YmgE family stress response membrane protein [Spongiactinospora gelatinilytica]
MGIIAWIILGLVTGYVAKLIIGGQDLRGLTVACLLGVTGALFGGTFAVQSFDSDIGAFFDLTAWITAVAGAAIVLVTYNVVNLRRRIPR